MANASLAELITRRGREQQNYWLISLKPLGLQVARLSSQRAVRSHQSRTLSVS
jgi:hypothetical protein